MGNTISCEKCYRICINRSERLCKRCQISSGNDKIDNLIKEMQLKIKSPVFEWIPYNMLSDIEIIAEYEFTKLYSAIWKDGPLTYNVNKIKYIRNQNMKVNLKCLYNSQNIINEFLNKV